VIIVLQLVLHKELIIHSILFYIFNIYSESAIVANPIDEFKEIVNLLPPYDKNNPSSKQLYDMFIDYFGTEASISTLHGNLIFYYYYRWCCLSTSFYKILFWWFNY
jgi:hypothetical protein